MKKIFSFAMVVASLALTSACKNSENCIDQSKADPDKVCTTAYKPVCGCDGKTYGNECEADRAGVTSFKEGACDENSKRN